MRFLTIDGQNGTGKTTLATLPEYIAGLAVHGQIQKYEWCRYDPENIRRPAEFELAFTVGELYFKYAVDIDPETGELTDELLVSGKLSEAEFEDKEQKIYYYDAAKNELSVNFLKKDSVEIKRILESKNGWAHSSILSQIICMDDELSEIVKEDENYVNLNRAYCELSKLLDSSKSSITIDIALWERYRLDDFLSRSGLSSNYVAKLIEIENGYSDVYYNYCSLVENVDSVLVLDNKHEKLYRVIIVDKFLKDASAEDIAEVYLRSKSRPSANIYKLVAVWYRLMIGEQPLIVIDDFNHLGSNSLIENFWTWVTSVKFANPETQIIFTGSLESIYRDSYGFYDSIYFTEHSPIFVAKKRSMKTVALPQYNLKWQREWIHYWNQRRMGGVTYPKGAVHSD